MVDVTVAVLTYRRNDDLVELLPALVDQLESVRGARAGWTGEVVVVDNDPARGAKDTVLGLALPPVRYVSEPVPGIPAARNRALDEGADSDVLVFIDDDERPQAGWLSELLAARERFAAAAVAGRVLSEFDGELDPWIANGGFFQRVHNKDLVTGHPVPAAATNNLLLDLLAVRRHGLRFDVSLGMAGGEDTLFTRRLVAAGETIVWCAEARVVDRVPASRMTRRFVILRVYAQSNASVVVALRLAGGWQRRPGLRLRYGVTGLGRLLGGGLRAVAGTVTRRDPLQASGLASAARGLGALAAVTGVRFEEYRSDHGH